tara:strand:- start:1310 stop:3673 length:2364 start_codon:yes stop_codon:yes gene_type:complete
MELILKETIDRKKLDALIACPDLNPDELHILKAMKKIQNKKDGTIVASYNKRMDMGRRYPDKSISIGSISKRCRHTLVGSTHTDIDIANCHPVILSQYCEKNGIVCKVLNDYVEHRNSRLQELIDTCDITRSMAKDMVLCVMYLGLLNDFCMTNKIMKSTPKWIDEFAVECKQISQIIKSKNEDVYKKVCASRNKEYNKNKVASTMSFVLQIIEDDLIMSARTKLCECGYSVEALCFDGLLILKQDIDEEILGNLSAYCEEKTGYNVNFEVKPMTLGIELVDEETEFDFSTYEHPVDKLENYDQVYCETLQRENPYEQYALKKSYIEKFSCKVLLPEPQYVFQNGLDRKCNFWNSNACSNAFTPITSGFKTMGGAVPFYSKWSQDVNQRLYKRFDFIPYNNEKTSECPKDVLNVFEGFNPDIYGPEIDKDRIGKLIKPYMDLVQELCGGDDTHSMYLHKWVAQMFQDPLHKPPVAIIIKGKQGTGKNMFLDAIGNMLNKTHYITSSNPDDFYGSHAEGYYRKLLVNLNEAEGKKTFDYEGNMKSMITEDTMTINPKNVRPSNVLNCARTCITTNKPTPVPIDVRSKDRRYVVFETTDKYLNKSSTFWANLYKHLRKPEVMSALYQMFMWMDLKDFNWIKKRPLTQAYKEMCNLYSPVESLFFEEVYLKQSWRLNDDDEYEGEPDDPNDIVTMSVNSIYSEYEKFIKKNKFSKDMNIASSRSFVSKLIELDFPVVRGRTSKDKNMSFKPQEVLDHSIANGWLMGYEKEMEELNDDNKDEDPDDDYFDI